MSDKECPSSQQKSSDCAGESLSPKEEIEVILAEYSAREEEKNQTIASLMNALTAAIAIFAGLFAFIYQAGRVQLWVVIPALILIFLSMETDRQFSILYSNIYIGLLEERVNKIAGKNLLMWEHLGTSYRNYIGKFVVRHPLKNQCLVNIGIFMLIAYVAVPMFIFGYGLFRASEWLASVLPYSQSYNIIIVIAYVSFHLIFLCLTLFNRFVQHKKLLKLLESKLRDEIFYD